MTGVLPVNDWHVLALRRATLAPRCSECRHEARFHSTGKCWYSETTGTVTRMLLCRCGQA